MDLSTNHSGFRTHEELMRQFVQETLVQLDGMIELRAHSDFTPINLAPQEFASKMHSVVLPVCQQGNGTGKLVMSYELESALAVANRVRSTMLGTHENARSITPEVAEALAEFGNIVIGLATRHFPPSRKITFGTPIYVLEHSEGAMLLEGVSHIDSVAIELEIGGLVLVSYLT